MFVRRALLCHVDCRRRTTCVLVWQQCKISTTTTVRKEMRELFDIQFVYESVYEILYTWNFALIQSSSMDGSMRIPVGVGMGVLISAAIEVQEE